MTTMIAISGVALLALGVAVKSGCIFCSDGWLSGSSGGKGTCSWHGGINRDDD